ncbi:MAG: glyoxalase [Halobacteriovoraceae bacterium]|nr:glyoxalase [Halobacteriovoraceae bacterium]|tara:strand:- start:36217 stop:36597 length:381 start_codon:yes stop_codon:yes gene_type:complete
MSLDAIGIACRDLEKSIRFYELLGLEFSASGSEHYEATSKTGMRIMLDSFELMKKINPKWNEPEKPGITLCFLQDSPALVDETFQKIVDAGFNAEKEPWDAFWGQRYSTVKDPDGNQIDIFASIDK